MSPSEQNSEKRKRFSEDNISPATDAAISSPQDMFTHISPRTEYPRADGPLHVTERGYHKEPAFTKQLALGSFVNNKKYDFLS